MASLLSRRSTTGWSERRSERITLCGFVVLMALSGIGLAAVAGPPHGPTSLPHLQDLLSTLKGSTLPAEPLALALVDLAWLMWGWIVASLGLELLVEATEALAHGRAWVRSLRHLTNRVTFPLARRAVAAAFALQILSRGVPLASAQTLTPAETAYVAVSDRHADAAAALTAITPVSRSAPAGAHYTVRGGDTLWSIADQAYGSGMAYRRLVEANVGRRMPDGQTFTVQGVIQPGWELVIPEANAGVEEVDGQRWYTVQPDDTLRRVAAVVVGDESQWREVFELNRGAASPDGDHVLADPNLIWPGLRLRLPASAAPVLEATPVEQAPPAEQATPVEQAPRTLQAPEPDAPSLVAASTALGASPSAIFEPSLPPIDAPEPAATVAAADPPPLVRTAHPPTVIALEPSDTTPALADPAPTPQADSGSPDQVAPDFGAWPPRLTVLRELPYAPLAVAGLGTLALAGVGWRARRARGLRALPLEPETAVTVEGGFAEAELSHDFTRGLDGVGFDPLAALVGHMQHVLDEHDLGDVGILALRHGRSSTTLTLTAGLARQSILIDLASTFGARLEADVDAWVTADQDIAMRVVRLRKTRLLPSAGAQPQSVRLVPLGVLFDRQVFVANSSVLGHTLVVSQAGHGADTILVSLLAAWTARQSPERLEVWLLAHPRSLPAPVFDLPHVLRAVDPTDEAALAHAALDLEAELDTRSLPTASSRPDLLVVVPELTSLGNQAATFEMLAHRAANLGVRFIASTGCPEDALLSPLTGHFGTRMVLRTQDEETSVALLGVADAAFLGGGGRLLLRLDGREPVELYGYQVAGEHLERLVRVMRLAYPSAAITPPTPPASRQASDPLPAEAPPDHASPPDATAAPDDAPPDATAPDDALPERTPPIAERPPPASVSSPAAIEAPLSAPPRGPLQPDTPRSTESPQPAVAGVPETAVADPPPLEVLCLGGPRVLCKGEQIWPRLPGGEAKPWEFLLYLACQPAEGVSSDEAVEALWPGLDEAADGPHRFRQLRYRLRHMLAHIDGAPSTDGICLERGVLRLDPRVVHSDAQEFLGLVRSARTASGPGAIQQLERARELYVGDVLEGPDARRYAWLDERDGSGVTLREHFRRLFQQSSTRLAELYVLAGDQQAAIDMYHELTAIDPSDERLWRALFRLHAERSDRLALVREDHRMRAALRRLAAELDEDDNAQIQDPSRETVHEYQRLLANLRNSEREATAV